MEEKELEMQVKAESDQAESSLDKLIASFERLDAQLSGVISKIESFGKAFEGMQKGIATTDTLAKKADRAAKSVKKANDAVQSVASSDIPASPASSGVSEPNIYPDGLGAASETAEEKAKRLEEFAKRSAKVTDSFVYDAKKIQQEIDVIAGKASSFSRNVTGKSDVGVLIGKDAQKSDAAYAKKVASEYQSAANAVARLRQQLSAKVSSGGVLSDTEVGKIDTLRARLATLRKEFDNVFSHGFNDKSLDSSVLTRNDMFADIESMSAKNEALRDYDKSIDRVASTYQKLLTHMQDVVANGGVIRNTDIRKAARLESELKDLNASAQSIGIKPVGFEELLADFQKLQKASQSNAIQKQMDKVSASIDKAKARLENLQNARTTAIANGRSVAGINSRIKQVSESIAAAEANLRRMSLEQQKLNGELSRSERAFALIDASAKSLPTRVAQASKRVSGLVGKLAGVNRAFSLISGSMRKVWRLVEYRVLRTLVANTMKDLDTCYRYVAKADKQFNTLMDTIRKGWADIGAAVASALLPLINAFGPAAISVMDALANAVHNVGMAVAAMTGATTYTKMTASVSDYAAGLDGANKSAKALKNTLAGFDTFNLLDDTSGSSSSSGTTYKKEEIQLDLSEGTVLKKFADIGKELSNLATGIKQTFSSAWRTIADGIDFDLSPFDFIVDKVRAVSQCISANSEPLGRVFGNAALILGDIAGIMAKVAGDVVGFVADLLGIKGANTVLDKLAGILEKIHGFLRDNSVLIENTIKTLGALWAISTVVNTIARGLQAISRVVGVFKGIPAALSKAAPLFSKVGAGVSGIIASADAALASMGALASGVVNAGAVVAGVFLGLGAYKHFFPESYETDLNVWKAFFRDIGESFKVKWGEIKEWFSTSLPAWFSTTFDKIKQKFGDLKDGFIRTLSGFGTWVKEAIPSFFNDAWNSVKEGWNKLGNWFQNTGLYKFFAGLGDKIKSAFDGLNVGKSASIATRASGGTVNMGQLFIANERGPELVGQIGGKTAVANQAQVYKSMYSGIHDAVVSGLREVGAGGSSDGDINMTVNLDGDPIYRGVVKRNKSQVRQTGKNPLMA